MKQEYILCAAVHYDDGVYHHGQTNNVATGIVVGGWRHSNCRDILVATIGKEKYDVKLFNKASAQGFLTSKNRFISRQEAFKMFKKCNPDWEPFDEYTDKLFSEDLY